MHRLASSWLLVVLTGVGCATAAEVPPLATADTGKEDAQTDSRTPIDASKTDSGSADTSLPDTLADALTDSRTDSGSDAGSDAANDSGSDSADASVSDAKSPDASADAAGDADAAVTLTGSIAFTPAADTPIRGGSGGGAPVDDCPAGELPTGIDIQVASAYYNGVVARFRTLCSRSQVVPDGTGWKLTLTAGSMMPASGFHGSYGYVGALASSRCPAEQVIVGFEGRSGEWLNAISLRCAPLVFTASTVSVGTVTTQPAVGSSSGTAFSATDCAAGTIARGVALKSGEVIDGFGLRCGTPSVAP